MKATSIELYQIVGFDMERYIELYRYAIGEKDVVEVEPFVPMADFRLRTGNISQEDYERLKADEGARMVGKTVHCKQKRGVMVSTDKITAKCQYLQDAIIRRAFAQKDTMSFSLSPLPSSRRYWDTSTRASWRPWLRWGIFVGGLI